MIAPLITRTYYTFNWRYNNLSSYDFTTSTNEGNKSDFINIVWKSTTEMGAGIFTNADNCSYIVVKYKDKAEGDNADNIGRLKGKNC